MTSDVIRQRLLDYLRKTDSPVVQDLSEVNRLVQFIELGIQRVTELQSYQDSWPAFPQEDIIRHIFAAATPEEALWCGYLATIFGRLSTDDEGDWRSAGRFYLGFGQEPFWTWDRVSRKDSDLLAWLKEHQIELDGFISYGNHRHYQSKMANEIFVAIDSYVSETQGLQVRFFTVSGTPTERFDTLFHRMCDRLVSIERLAAFDHLTMCGNFGLLPVEPGSTYLDTSTGPRSGAKKLWPHTPKRLQKRADRMAEELEVPYQAIEDALCNWSKRR